MPNGKPTKKPKKNSQLKKFHKDASPLFHLRKLKTDPNRKAIAVIQSQTLVPVTFSPPQKEIVSRLGPLFESPSPMRPLAAKVVQVEGTPLKTPPNTTWQTPGGTELELSARHSCHSINGAPIAFYSSKKGVLFRSRITEFETETETETETDSELRPVLRLSDEVLSPTIHKEVIITRSDIQYNIKTRPREKARTQSSVLGIAAKDVPKPESITSHRYAQAKEILHIIGYSICPEVVEPQAIENFVIGSAAANTQMMISEGLIHRLLSFEEFENNFDKVFYSVTIAEYDQVDTLTTHGFKAIIVAKKIITTIQIIDKNGQLLFTHSQEIDVFSCDKPPVTDLEFIFRAAYLEIKKVLDKQAISEAADVDMTPKRRLPL